MKVVNIHTNNVVTLIGKGETIRFVNISLYQGAPKKTAVLSLVKLMRDGVSLAMRDLYYFELIKLM